MAEALLPFPTRRENFAGIPCTGMELHGLSTRVLWKIAPIGRLKTNVARGWSALPIVTEKNTNNYGWLGSSLGEATINLYMKIRVEDINIIFK